MKVLFVNTHFFSPQSHGGMANTLNQLCHGLIARGHQVSVLAGFRNSHDFFEVRSRLGMKLRETLGGFSASRDTGLGYPVWRAWSPEQVLTKVAAIEQPDVIVAMGGRVVPVIEEGRKTSIPLLIQIHDVEEHWLGGDLKGVADIPTVANSHFTASVLRKKYNIEAQVIYPFIPLEKYRVESARKSVFFVNPILRKGFWLGHQIARLCPEIPFVFVGDIPSKDEDGSPIDLESIALANLTFEPFNSDMRTVYNRCRILIAPSQWEEAYGRVINEAQVSAIPALASDRGGIPEAMAGGGMLLPADAAATQWADALRQMWTDGAFYQSLCVKAIESAKRPELQAEFQMEAHETALENAKKFNGFWIC